MKFREAVSDSDEGSEEGVVSEDDGTVLISGCVRIDDVAEHSVAKKQEVAHSSTHDAEHLRADPGLLML